jgi:predicted metal-binding membrane protein
MRALLGVPALVFTASSAVTIAWCGSMSGGMPMAGGWTMSMAWMRMAGQTWPGAAATFVGMWIVMMVAMMLPSLVSMLRPYRGRSKAIVAGGYFAVWTLLGVALYPLGVALAEIAMGSPTVSRAVPIAAAVVVLVAGIVQLTSWKARQLACCREESHERSDLWQHGVRLGLRCVTCCAPLTAILLVAGVMDLRAMALVTAAITAERVAPSGERIARVVGAMGVAAGMALIGKGV